VFPTSPHTANIGCGVFFESRTPQPTHLRYLIQSHPYLKRILRNARQVGPIKGHPLRTDFSRFLSGKGQILVTGEALGLVNPITGEGIDYALESAKMAAEAILNGWQAGTASPMIHKKYGAALGRKVSFPFTLYHLAQSLFFRDGLIDQGLRRIQHSSFLRQVVIESAFGLGNPTSIFSLRTFWEIAGPQDG